MDAFILEIAKATLGDNETSEHDIANRSGIVVACGSNEVEPRDDLDAFDREQDVDCLLYLLFCNDLTYII